MVFTLYNSCCASKAHFFPKIFFPVYPIMGTGFLYYDFSPFSFFFLEYSSKAIAEMNDFLFPKCNH